MGLNKKEEDLHGGLAIGGLVVGIVVFVVPSAHLLKIINLSDKEPASYTFQNMFSNF